MLTSTDTSAITMIKVDINYCIAKGWVKPRQPDRPEPAPDRHPKHRVHKGPVQPYAVPMQRMPFYDEVANAGLRLDGKPRVRKPYRQRHDLRGLTPEQRRERLRNLKREWRERQKTLKNTHE
jgi:hypothetical protein